MGDLFYLALIWCGVLLGQCLADRTQLTPVLWFLAFGALLVNLGWLPQESSEFIRGFSELGIILIMFALGFEESSAQFVKTVKKAWGIALFGAVAPFLTAYYLTLSFWQDRNMALMCGLAMTATAVSLTMVSLRSENLHTSRAARGIMASAVIDGVSSMVLVAILVPIATGVGPTSIGDIALIVLKAMAFFAVVTAMGIWIFPHNITQGFCSRIPVVRSYGVKHLMEFSRGEQTTLVVLLLAVVVGIAAYAFGFHPAVGAYMAGLVLKEEYFHLQDHPRVNSYLDTKRIVDNVAFSWIGPVFFVELGSKLVLDTEVFLSVVYPSLILIAGLAVAQVTSAGLAARYLGNFEPRESVLIGLGMLGRAELAFVVMDIAYVEHAIITRAAFYTLMFTAFALNVAVPVSIRLWKPYYSAVED
ncbi:MAG: cation:proton antiporter [Gammaproteobacteria bacterium]|jgi:Kef-type K+ transport system membrane component KefB